jgi:hypothetical protein
LIIIGALSISGPEDTLINFMGCHGQFIEF